MAVNLRNSTHEAYIAGVRDLIIARAQLTDEQLAKLSHAKLLYGAGQAGVRGVCYFEAWENGIGKVDVIEIGAMTQESWVQLAGTTLHELAHVLAGNTAGHSAEWKAAAQALGFTKRPEAAGQRYSLAIFNGTLREQIAQLAQTIADGSPAFRSTFNFAGLEYWPPPVLCRFRHPGRPQPGHRLGQPQPALGLRSRSENPRSEHDARHHVQRLRNSIRARSVARSTPGPAESRPHHRNRKGSPKWQTQRPSGSARRSIWGAQDAPGRRACWALSECSRSSGHQRARSLSGFT